MRLRSFTVALLIAGTVATAAPRRAEGLPFLMGMLRTGPQFALDLGVAGCTDTYCDNLDPSAAVGMHFMYRPYPFLAAGLNLSFLLADADNAPFLGLVRTSDVWNLFVGPEVRGILPISIVDFWISFTFAYGRTELKTTLGDAKADGFALGFGFGLDFFFFKNTIAAGVGFNLYKPFYDEVCGDLGCTNLDKSQLGIAWAFTFNFTAVIGIVTVFPIKKAGAARPRNAPSLATRIP